MYPYYPYPFVYTPFQQQNPTRHTAGVTHSSSEQLRRDVSPPPHRHHQRPRAMSSPVTHQSSTLFPRAMGDLPPAPHTEDVTMMPRSDHSDSSLRHFSSEYPSLQPRPLSPHLRPVIIQPNNHSRGLPLSSSASTVTGQMKGLRIRSHSPRRRDRSSYHSSASAHRRSESSTAGRSSAMDVHSRSEDHSMLDRRSNSFIKYHTSQDKSKFSDRKDRDVSEVDSSSSLLKPRLHPSTVSHFTPKLSSMAMNKKDESVYRCKDPLLKQLKMDSVTITERNKDMFRLCVDVGYVAIDCRLSGTNRSSFKRTLSTPETKFERAISQFLFLFSKSYKDLLENDSVKPMNVSVMNLPRKPFVMNILEERSLWNMHCNFYTECDINEEKRASVLDLPPIGNSTNRIVIFPFSFPSVAPLISSELVPGSVFIMPQTRLNIKYDLKSANTSKHTASFKSYIQSMYPSKDGYLYRCLPARLQNIVNTQTIRGYCQIIAAISSNFPLIKSGVIRLDNPKLVSDLFQG